MSDKSKNGAEQREWKAVCHKDGCRGINHGPYSDPSYARSDKTAHEKWHDERGEFAYVEVVKRPVDTDTEH